VRLLFNEGMNAETFYGHFTLSDESAHLVPGSFVGADTTVVFMPSQPLAPATVYSGVLRGRIRDAQNISIALEGTPILDDTTVIMTTWFYTEGDYSQNGLHHIFMRDKKEGKVRVIGQFDSELATVPGFGAPEGMALSSDGMHLFVSSTSKDSVYSINTQTNSIETGFRVAAYPSSMTAYGNYVYVISINGRALTKINASSLTVERQTTLTFYPARLAISPDGTTLYTIDQVTRDLVLIRESDGVVTKRLANAVSTQVVTGDLVVDGATGNVYICNSKGLNIKVTDAAATSFTTFMTFAAGVEPLGFALTPGNSGVFFVAAGKTVQRGTLARPDSVSSVVFPGAVRAISVVPTGDILYATQSLSVVILDARTLALLKEIAVTSSGIEGILPSTTKYQ